MAPEKSRNLQQQKKNTCKPFLRKYSKSLLIQIKDFCNETSMHGLKYVAKDDNHLTVRILWIAMFTVGVLTSAYLCLQVWTNWEEFPLSVTFQATNYPVELINFPAVTICNVNKVSRQKLLNLTTSDTRWAAVELEDLRSALRILTSISSSVPNFETVIPRLKNIMNDSSITIEDFKELIQKVTPSCEDMLVSCKWQGRETRCSRMFITRQTDDGLCCSFTSYTKNVAVLQGGPASPDLVLAGNFCRLPSAGISTGLSVILNANVDDYNASTVSFNGFKVLIHDANDYPDVGERGFFVGAGYDVSVGIDANVVTGSPSVRGVKFEKRNCLTQDERKLDFFPIYTTPNCIIEKFTREMIKACQCKPYFYPGNGTDCNVGAYDCLIRTYARYRIRSQTSLQCPYTCTDTWYGTEISYASYPGHNFRQAGFDKVVTKKYPSVRDADVDDYVARNLAALRLYYRRQTGVRLVMSDRYGWQDIVSSVGGLLGLGFGFSFISAVEIIYFLCCKQFGKFLKKRGTNQENQNPAAVYRRNKVEIIHN